MDINWVRQIKRLIERWHLGIIVIGLVVLVRGLGWLQLLELIAFDYYLRQLPAESVDSRITIVGINEEDIQAIGNYPLPDRELAKLLAKLSTYQPVVVGIDLFRDLPVEPGYQALVAQFKTHQNLIVIEKVLPPNPVAPPEEISSEQVGFADVILDNDGHVRRSLLGMYRDESKQKYVFSFSLKLAAAYLATQDIALENGIKDSQTMRFGSIEIPRFHSNTGGYAKADDFGVQTLINFRRGKTRFSVVSLQEVMTDKVATELLQNRIVIIGITADSIKDIFSTSAIAELNPPGVIRGVEFHAHAASQIISAVLDRRPLLTTLPKSIEYFLIIICGLTAIVFGRLSLFPWKNLIIIISIGSLLAVIAYLCLWIGGWWLPVVPALLVFIINGIAYTAFYQNERFLKAQITLRQTTIEDTFTAIHNGPLQLLASILRSIREQKVENEQLLAQLENLNQEIRALGEYLRVEVPQTQKSTYSCPKLLTANMVVNGKKISLDRPIHQLWRAVYEETLKRDNFPHFKTIKAKVVEFEPLEFEDLNLRQKQKLAEFLEEALCNVGKHAEGATRLIVTGTRNRNYYTLSVKDNGIGLSSHYEGRGTKQFRNLEKSLKGKWRRDKANNRGTVCEFTWSLSQNLNKNN